MEHRVVIVGNRRACQRYSQAFQATERAKLAWVVADAETAEDVADLPNVTVYSHLDAARSFRTTAAVVASSAPSRVAAARQAIAAGWHVLIDAPLSTSLDGVEDLRRESREKTLVVAVCYPDREYPLFKVLREALLEQRFGPPLQLTALRGAYLPADDPNYAETDYADRTRGGGAVQHALTYLLNLGEWLVGPIDRLVADVDRLALDGVSVEDSVHVLARHGRLMAAYVINQHQRPAETSIIVHCAEGTVRAELPENRLRWLTDSDGKWSEQVFDALDTAGVELEQAHQFLNAVEGRAAWLCTLDQAVQTLRVQRAVLASAAQRVWEGSERETK